MQSPSKVIKNTLLQTFILFLPMRHWLSKTNKNSLKDDFFAGITGAIVVLPQGIAFAVIAGLPPEFGLYSAIIVQLIAGFFGSSLQMVTGPTVALSIVIPGIINNYAPIGTAEYISLSLSLMLLVGFIQLIFGIFRLGSLITFISHTVIVGFCAGAGFLIIVNQLPAFFGIDTGRENALIKIPHIIQQLPQSNWYSLSIALITFIITIIIRKYYKKLPHMLIGLVCGVITGFLLDAGNNGVKMLGSLPNGFPNLVLPDLSYKTIGTLLPSAAALALLGLIEAASIARSIALRTGQRIDSNQEFFGQGLANLVGSCCSCYVGSGSFNRSAINLDSGAKSPFSLLFSSLIVILILIFAPNITYYLPLPAVAATIIVTGYNLFDFKNISLTFHTSKSELGVILITLFATLFINLEFAIYAGVIMSLLLYLNKASHPAMHEVDFSKVEKQKDHPNLTVLRLDGSLFFGATDHFENLFAKLNRKNQWQYVVILAEGLNLIDIAGLESLMVVKKNLQKNGGDLYLIGMKPHLRQKLSKSPYWQYLGGEKNLFESTYLAFGTICKSININNYRAYMKHLFRDYQKI